MSTRRCNPEQIVNLLRKLDVVIANGKTPPQRLVGSTHLKKCQKGGNGTFAFPRATVLLASIGNPAVEANRENRAPFPLNKVRMPCLPFRRDVASRRNYRTLINLL